MAVYVGGVQVTDEVKFNGTTVDSVKVNGTTVWTKFSVNLTINHGQFTVSNQYFKGLAGGYGSVSPSTFTLLGHVYYVEQVYTRYINNGVNNNQTYRCQLVLRSQDNQNMKRLTLTSAFFVNGFTGITYKGLTPSVADYISHSVSTLTLYWDTQVSSQMKGSGSSTLKLSGYVG